MWTFQTESRKKARKLIVERLMGSSPVWLTKRGSTVIRYLLEIDRVLLLNETSYKIYQIIDDAMNTFFENGALTLIRENEDV